MTHDRRRAAIDARVATLNGQTPENQLRQLRGVAEKAGREVVGEFVDHGISGARGRDQRPAFDRLCKAATRREIDVVMAWSVDRLGRSLQDLVAFLGDLQAAGVRRRPLPAPAGGGHHHAGRQGAVPDDGRVRRV